jgi:hypothetical protein
MQDEDNPLCYQSEGVARVEEKGLDWLNVSAPGDGTGSFVWNRSHPQGGRDPYQNREILLDC